MSLIPPYSNLSIKSLSCQISFYFLGSYNSCTMWDFSSNFPVSKILSNEGKLSFEKRGVINLKICDKMQLLFSIYEFYSKVGVKLEILTPNMMILNFAFLSYDCLNIWKNLFIKTLITFFFLNLLQRSQHRKFLWKCIKNF